MDWQKRYEMGDTPWDKGSCAPSLSDLLERRPDLFSSKNDVFVPGCGLGYDARALARVSGSVLGADISELAVERAGEIGGDGVEFRVLDIFDLPDDLFGGFDMVWEHTCFCAIPPEARDAYVESMWRALKPMGMVLGVFFVDPNRGLDGPPYLLKREEIVSYFSSYLDLEWESAAAVSYPGREGQEHLFLFRKISECTE